MTSSLLVRYEWSKARFTLCTYLICPVTFTKVCPIPIPSNMHWWSIEIKEIPKYKRFDNIGDLSKATFWYHSNDTKRNTWLVLCSLPNHPAIYTLPFTLQLCYKPLSILQRVTKSQKVHISSHDKLQNLHNINFPGHRSRGFLREGLENRNFLLILLLF